jgi:cell division protease FtsH
MLKEHERTLDAIAEYLIREETITGKQFMEIFKEVEQGE